ncbi:MAG: hypothetical protein KAR21_14850 [Spirochaetales bacterium]|nr:hypothetical protein [Spirochaetales bacterium]
MGILSALSKKKKEEPLILSVETLIPELFRKSFKKITGNISKVELFQEKFANWQIYLTGADNGYVLKFFRSSTRSPLLVFFPSDFILKYAPSVNGKDLSSKLLKFLGDLPLYLLSEESKEIDSVIDSGSKAGLPEYVFSELKGKEELLWQTSGARIFTVKFESAHIYLFLEEAEFCQFNGICRESEITLNKIQNLSRDISFVSKDESHKGSDPPVSMGISKEADFALGRFFLPRRILLGDHNAVSGFDTVSFESEQSIAEGGIYFVLDITIHEKPFSINYFIPAKDESRDSLSGMMQSMIKAVLPVWRKFFEVIKVGGGQRSRAAVGVLQGWMLTGSIKYQNSQIPIKVSIPNDVVILFSGRFLESEDIINFDLGRIILLNSTLFNIFLKENLFPSLTLPEFFNLIDNADLRRVVQNYFSGTGWNSEAMQPLFIYSKKVVEQKKIYYFYDPLFDRSRFFSFLPKAQKDEWKRSREASGSREEMISAGRKALKEIYHAFRDDHLDLSFKSSILLRNEFKIRGEGKIRKELDLLMQKEPLSILLENKFAGDVQNLLAGLTAKVLANALVLYTNNLESLEPFISRNYRAEVKELIKISQRKSAADGFEMEEIRTDLLTLHNGLKDLSTEKII